MCTRTSCCSGRCRAIAAFEHDGDGDPEVLLLCYAGYLVGFVYDFFFSVCFTAVEMSAMNSTIACVPYAGIIICIMNDGFNNNATHGVV